MSHPRLTCISVFFFFLQWWQVEKVNPIKLYEENKVIAGFSLLNLLFKHGKCSLVKSVMDKLLCLYNQKKVKPVVDSLWALEEVRTWSGQRVIFYNHLGQHISCCLSLLLSVGHYQLFLDRLPQMVGRLLLPLPQSLSHPPKPHASITSLPIPTNSSGVPLPVVAPFLGNVC